MAEELARLKAPLGIYMVPEIMNTSAVLMKASAS